MTNPTPQQCREWIEHWSDKTESFGCLGRSGQDICRYGNRGEWEVLGPIGWGYTTCDEIIGHPLTIGRVLALMSQRKGGTTSKEDMQLIGLWYSCSIVINSALERSLNTILEEAEMTEEWIPCGSRTGTINRVGGALRKDEILTGPAADLFSFLLEVLPVTNSKI